jgi:acetyl esterase
MSGQMAIETGLPMDDRYSDEMAALMRRLEIEDALVPDPTLLPPLEARAQVERCDRRWNRELPSVLDIQSLDVQMDLQARATKSRMALFRPELSKPGAILYIHGGGWAFCSIATHERLIRSLANSAAMPVVGTTYRQTPEHPFPMPLDDCISAWRWLQSARHSLGLSEGPLLLAGDSAGANLALGLMLHELQARLPVPDGALLFYGTYDDDFDSPSHRRFGLGFGLTTDRMRRYWDWYVPQARRSDPLAVPLKASDELLRGLPPLFLVGAGLDCLLSETTRLADRLRALGRHDVSHVYPGVIHGFLQMDQFLSTARAALADAGVACRTFSNCGQWGAPSGVPAS